MALEWTDHRYGSGCDACVGAFAITVEWSENRAELGYNVRFANRTLKKRFRNREDAKQAGVRLARKVLTEALTALTDGGDNG
jgi:hypothetical protein